MERDDGCKIVRKTKTSAAPRVSVTCQTDSFSLVENLIGGCSDANVNDGVPFRRTSIGSNSPISLSRSFGIFPFVIISRNSFNLGFTLLVVTLAFWIRACGFWGFLIRRTVSLTLQGQLGSCGDFNPNSEVEKGWCWRRIWTIRCYAKQSYCRPSPNHPD